ncbi:MAG TPA: bifunctional diaminohydroxyphosphoribosylaminopyrimidine deaminase/5-amino-6-(5-phosphoribosylamino)uracil reductase RibD [Chthoniobacterales bacterium]
MVSALSSDDKFMRAALDEARKGLGHTSPNPVVGAVVVRAGRIISRGHHRAAGGPHAEIEAVAALKNPDKARGATIYVTLEPCSTYGRTPPCTEAILRHGFARVVYGATDPNPAHAGRADDLLRAGGVDVERGVLGEECSAINAAWNHWIVTRRPYVIAKCGMSLDGRISSHPESRWITNEGSRKDAMELRARVDAILVGGETVRTDDPHLTVRGIPGARQPLRIVWTRSGDLPAEARLFTDKHRERTLVFAGRTLRATLDELGRKHGVTSVLIEGGGRVLGEVFDRHLAHRAVIYVAPQLLGGPVPAVAGHGADRKHPASRLTHIQYRRIGDDVRVDGVLD